MTERPERRKRIPPEGSVKEIPPPEEEEESDGVPDGSPGDGDCRSRGRFRFPEAPVIIHRFGILLPHPRLFPNFCRTFAEPYPPVLRLCPLETRSADFPMASLRRRKKDMRQAVILGVAGALLMAGAFGRDLPDDVVREPHRVVGKDAALPDRYAQTSPVNEILVTADNQILVELALDEANRPHLFDLNGRTLVFTPDATGQYSREVRALEWEEEIGEEVEINFTPGSWAVVMLESFDFPFAGQRWESFHLGSPGVVTFGEPFTYSYSDYEITMQEIADEFISVPTISALYKPWRYGTQHVARRTDRIVITWLSWESVSWEYGVRPEKPARFQTVLGSDGSIRFNYIDVPFEDGIVGLFQEEDLAPGVDLSQSESRVSNRHHEVFHFRSVSDTHEIACHLIGVLGDAVDVYVFHSENRMDKHGIATAWAGPCRSVGGYNGYNQGRLKGHWHLPVWIKSEVVFDASSPFKPYYFDGFDSGLDLFAHEFAHTWLADFSYDKSGQREPLFLPVSEGGCNCHWRWEFHTPAVFPWHTEAFGPSSIMGGSFWLEHGQGRFTRNGNNPSGGFSWLDLYAMGLADAEEVPDMFIVRNLQFDADPNEVGYYTGEKETVTIDQIVAAEGPRVPGTAHSQKVFNAGFVYLLEPGQTPSGDLLDLHVRYQDKVMEHWSHITGGRSRITTVVPQIANNRPPRAVGRIEGQPLVLSEGGMAVRVEVKGYFSDPDGDPLTYKVTSSDDEVAVAGMSGSIVTINPGSAGQATVTVTAKDGRGGLAYQTIAIVVDGKPERNPSDFIFVPVILSAEGRNDAFFTSELTLTNRGSELATVDFTYTAHAGGGSGTVREYLEPGRQWIIPDAIEYLRERGLPIPATGNRIGTLRVASSRLGTSDLGVTVRTTTEVPEGRAGLAYPGVGVEAGFEDAVYVCGLRQNEQDRSNVALQHMGTPEDGPITLRATVFSGNAEISEGHLLEDRILVPGGFYQYNRILNKGGFTNGYVKVERVEGTAPFYAYGVINDQGNSDGSFVFPVTASSLEEPVRYSDWQHTLPVVVETGSFTSELTVTNFSEEAKSIHFSFVADGIRTDDQTARFALTLEAGQQRIIPDILHTQLRQMGVEGMDPGRGGLAGALLAWVGSDDPSGIVIGARTGSPDGRGGQYGVFYNAVPDRAAFTGFDSAWIYGLQQNGENRSNLALVNIGPFADSVFGIDIYDGETGALVKTITRTVPPHRWHQINGILGNHAPAITQGYVRIRRFSGNDPFLAYGVVNDGGAPGERSGDGAFLPPRE